MSTHGWRAHTDTGWNPGPQPYLCEEIFARPQERGSSSHRGKRECCMGHPGCLHRGDPHSHVSGGTSPDQGPVVSGAEESLTQATELSGSSMSCLHRSPVSPDSVFSITVLKTPNKIHYSEPLQAHGSAARSSFLLLCGLPAICLQNLPTPHFEVVSQASPQTHSPTTPLPGPGSTNSRVGTCGVSCVWFISPSIVL